MDKVFVSGGGHGIERYSTPGSSGDHTCARSGVDGTHARTFILDAEKIRGIGKEQIVEHAELIFV